MKYIFVAAATLATLSSCTNNGPAVSTGTGLFVSKTAADAALPGAYSVRLITPDLLQPGHIYKAAGGTFSELCALDVRDQNALKAITVVAGTPSADVVSDSARFSQAEINAFGVKLGPSYQIRKVTGFQTFTAQAPTSDDIPSYILANVRRGDKTTCRDGVLKDPKNKPYIVVEATVVAKKVDVTNKSSFSVSGSAGGVGGSVGTADSQDAERTNVVFGAKGLFITK